MKDRLLKLRNELKLNQAEFGEKIGLSKASISALESGSRNITDRHIMLLSSEFNVNENWLRSGEGEMFVQQETFSLDEKAQKYQLSPLEIDIMKGYMELDPYVRNEIIKMVGEVYVKHTEIAATTVEDEIEDELERYRYELKAEKKAGTSLVSEERGTS
ncbi:helix-turn-helix domain-containing protein [Lysinibacillus parviboronicapiens]|uniref:helix-turn-helix domain-containing protein n=1 Tax=Lysinibacillus parviboronicapiens TaxID=436516 RepID=UPI000D3B1D4B|nr:helix-turn-helix transcriptional regulator [Lysinibacillus parviboronicapiens]